MSVLVASDSLVLLMSRLQLIVPERFDYFLLDIISWYEQESIEYEGIPNVYNLFQVENLHSQHFMRHFMTSFAERHAQHNGLVSPTSTDCTDEIRYSYQQTFMTKFHSMQRYMIHDIELVLGHLNFSYIWDETNGDAEGQIWIKNSAIVEVW